MTLRAIFCCFSNNISWITFWANIILLTFFAISNIAKNALSSLRVWFLLYSIGRCTFWTNLILWASLTILNRTSHTSIFIFRRILNLSWWSWNASTTLIICTTMSTICYHTFITTRLILVCFISLVIYWRATLTFIILITILTMLNITN